MKCSAFAKINPYLSITGRREDGYHDLRLIFLPITLHDELEAELSDEPGLWLTCSDRTIPPENNLITKAYDRLKRELPDLPGMRVRVEKRIPSGAGLGGGSADAAAFLKAALALSGRSLPADRLLSLAAGLGADVPAMLLCRPSLGLGIGDRLTELPSALSASVLVVRPDFACATGAMYAAYDTRNDLVQPDRSDRIADALARGSLPDLSRDLFNVFEQLLPPDQAKKAEEIKVRLAELGAAGALLTGSGSCVFGLFEKRETMEAAAAGLRDRYEAFPAELLH